MKTTINGNGFTAEFNEDLDGYILTFSSGNLAQTQFDIETNRLHADFGEKFLRRYTDYDSDLTEDENALVEAFIDERNHSKEF